MNESKIVFADVQGYKSSKERFVFKEICILNEDFRIHEIIRRPYPINNLSFNFKKQVKWTVENYHGINWNEGNISLSKLKREVKSYTSDVDIVFVKGSEKVKWIENIFPNNIVALNIENYQNTSDFYESAYLFKLCENHKINKSTYHCALQNALLLQKCFNEKNEVFFDLP